MPSPAESVRVPVLAVVNTSVEIVRLIEAVFEIEGFKVVTAFTLDIKEGRLDFDRFIADHQPDAVVWDIAIPYEANWAFFQQVRASPAGHHCTFVLTTTNKLALHQLVGEVPVHELIGKPFDLDDLVNAVRRSIDQDPRPRDMDRDRPSHD